MAMDQRRSVEDSRRSLARVHPVPSNAAWRRMSENIGQDAPGSDVPRSKRACILSRPEKPYKIAARNKRKVRASLLTRHDAARGRLQLLHAVSTSRCGAVLCSARRPTGMHQLFHDINWYPDLDERRAFGRTLTLGFLVITPLLWLLVWWKRGHPEMWPLFVGGGCAGAGAICWAWPRVAQPIYVFWYAVGGVIGFCLTQVLLVLVFYLVVTPIGLVLRLLGKDPLERRWDKDATTYWKDAEKPVDAKSYFRQF